MILIRYLNFFMPFNIVINFYYQKSDYNSVIAQIFTIVVYNFFTKNKRINEKKTLNFLSKILF